MMVEYVTSIVVWPVEDRSEPAIPTHCAACGGLLLIIDGGLFCEHACGKMEVVSVGRRYERLHPELVIKRNPVRMFAKAMKEAEQLGLWDQLTEE